MTGILALLWVLLGLPLATVSADTRHIDAGQLRAGTSLAGAWRFHAGDDMAWAAPDYDDGAWEAFTVPQRWPKGKTHDPRQFSWLRLTLYLDPQATHHLPPGQGIGVQIGKVLSAYELFAGGQLLGGVGGLPPHADVNYDLKRVYLIPASAIAEDGKLVLALRVWGGSALSVSKWGEGPHEGDFRIGDYDTLRYAGFVHELPNLVMNVLIAGFGLYHIYLFWRNRQLRTYLWYGLVALDISLFSFLTGQLRYSLGWSFTLLEKIEFSTIYLLPALFIQMLWSLLGARIGWVLRAIQLCALAFSLAALCVPGLSVLYVSLFPWELLCIPVLACVVWMIFRGVRAGNPEARTTLLGLILFVLACASDLMIDFAGWHTPRLLPLGFVAIMLSMAISLANRFTAMLSDLEGEVAQRTAELSAANAQLAAAARRDPLTGLLNRRGFLEVAAQEMQRFARTGRPFSLVLADLDNFKQFNDRHGHDCGDFVLQEVARLLDARVRDTDSVARWGGEEFMLIIPETGHEGAVQLAESLRLGVQNSRFQYGGQSLSVTMTLGMATFGAGDTLESCIARADTALYGGKEHGRNRVGGDAGIAHPDPVA